MYHTLIHIWGPIGIHSFGLFFALGLVICLYLGQRDPRRKQLMSAQAFVDAIVVSVLIGLVGSRILFVIQEWDSFDTWLDVFNLWSGGLSLLGSIPAIIIFLPLYLRRHHVPFLSFFDLITLYAPLLQSISRLGCYFAGCCFGSPTALPWRVTYTEFESSAPLCVALHPAQLYSSGLLALIFIFLYFYGQKKLKKPGEIFCAYLMLIASERIIVDFFRGDREYFQAPFDRLFSIHQWIAVLIFAAGLCCLIYLNYFSRAAKSTHHE
jgi:phosphatidylglycerol:prolipoprotein diacylglycerol transferase